VTLIDPTGMAEATRLTQAGRLTEATALLQRLLAGGEAPSAEPAAWHGPTLDLAPDPDPAARDQHHSRQARPAPRRRSPDALPGQWLDGAYANPFGRRPFKLYVPSRPSAAPMPLLVMLHGCTQNPDDFALGTGMNHLAEAEGYLVAYPGQIDSANPSKCWNWFQPTDQERERGEPSLVAGITRQVIEKHGADPTRVYVAGLSAGGAKAAIMAATYPDLYAAVGVHSGLADGAARDLPSALAAMRGGKAGADRRTARTFVPTIILHGAQDRTVHPANAGAILDQALAAAPKLAALVDEGRAPGGHAYRVTRHQTPDGRTLVEDWRIDGLAHAWSGGDTRGSHTDPRGPDASRALVDFFGHHRHAGTA
jgi:poly(hydroxyalkanoate) depolymerase family esterase